MLTFERVEEILNNLTAEIKEELESSTRELILSRIPKSSGKLADSLKVTLDVTNGRLIISMLDYGFYVNYGVAGTIGSSSDILVPPPSVSVKPSSLIYKFKKRMIGGPLPLAVRVSIAQKGLKPQPFLPSETDYANILSEVFTKVMNQ